MKTNERAAFAITPGKKIAEGAGRHHALTSVAGGLRARGLGGDAIYAALVPLNPEMFEVPLEDDDVKQIAYGIERRYPAGELLPEITLGKTATVVIGKPQPDAAKLPGRVRPEYPISAWEGTVVAEYAKLCANDNNVPKKLYAEAFRCVLGAVVGDRVACPGVEGALPRSYTIIVAPTATGTREAVYGEMLFSMLCGVTEEGWFDLLSRGNAVGGGLMSRLNIIGTRATMTTSAVSIRRTSPRYERRSCRAWNN